MLYISPTKQISAILITLSHSYFKGMLWPSGPIHLIINTGIPDTLMMHTLEVLVQLSMGYGQLVPISFLWGLVHSP
jgi:hypothetical protein